jgi:hypothetical protein
MIISHEHRFIFVHCRKVAGSSMKVALAPFLGPQDLVVGSVHEVMAAGIRLPRATRRMLRHPRALAYLGVALCSGRSFPESLNIGIKGYLKPRLSANPSHPSAEEAAHFVGPAWHEYFKFAFVRNPFERVVSDYLWRKRVTGASQSFSEYLALLERRDTRAKIVHDGAIPNWEMIALEDQIIMDRVGRFERLKDDFSEIMDELGLRGCALTAKAKANGKASDYGSFYSEGDILTVRRLFAREIETFDYRFPY